MAYKTDCSKFSYVGGGKWGHLSSCKEKHAEIPNLCPVNCKHYDGKTKSFDEEDTIIMDSGSHWSVD